MKNSLYTVTAALLLWTTADAQAQQYRFPTSLVDYPNFYPTAYYDHSGQDWNCQSKTYTNHRGSDYGVGSWAGMAAGQDVVAAADGVVTTVHDGEDDQCSSGDCPGGGGYGNHVYIQHPDGKVTRYAHFKQWSVAVAVNDVVSCGDLLGEVGSSGYSTGPHLHFEVRNVSNTAVEPFNGNCASGASLWVAQGPYDGLPEPLCDGATLPPCTIGGTLLCGDNLNARNDDPGSTSDTVFYGCSQFTYTGPELVWRFGTTVDEDVTLSMTGLSADLDLYVLEDTACDGSGCIEVSSSPNSSDETLTFTAIAGTEYVVLVDGWEGATSDFNLTVSCQGGDPFATPDAGVTDPDAAPTGDAAVSADASGTAGADSAVTGDADIDPPGRLTGGCSCRGHANGGSGALLLLLLAVLAVWRRRRHP